MPSVGLKESIDASIELSNFSLTYRPGDVLHGAINRIQLENPENVTVALKLVGRVKTSIKETKTDSDGKSSTTRHDGHAQLLNLQYPLFQGIATPGKNAWPFTITIPQTQMSWGPQDPHPAGRPLPPSHYVSDEYIDFADREYLYVKYMLEAHVQSKDKGGRSGFASFPLYLRSPTGQHAIQDQALRSQMNDQKIRTLHLLPELATEKLSLRQHMRSIFKPSAIPRYEYSVHVQYPTVIQQENRSTIQFKISAVSKLGENETSSSIAGNLPPITLVAAEVLLRSATHTDDLTANTFRLSDRSDGHWRDTTLINLDAESTPDGLQVPTDREKGNATLDLGVVTGLTLTARGVVESGTRLMSFRKPLYPSFYTYHVKHAHELKWKLTFMCASKKQVVKGEAPIMLLGPSEEREAEILRGLGEENIRKVHRLWAEGAVDAPVMALAIP